MLGKTVDAAKGLTWGSVFSWGKGKEGQLGNGNSTNWYMPQSVSALEGIAVTRVFAGRAHSAALTCEGTAYLWGANESGQCGVGSFSDAVLSPVLLSTGRTPSGCEFVRVGRRRTTSIRRSGMEERVEGGQ